MGKTHHETDRKTIGFTHPTVRMISLESMC